MHSHKILLAAAPLVAIAAADFELDPDDVPRQCRDICRPIVELGQRCETDDIRGATDREEDQLEYQCVCTNDSFAVGDVAGLCAACIYDAAGRTPNSGNNNNNNGDVYDDDDDDDDDDGVEDIDRIMRVCGFSSTSYSEQATTILSDITVSATPATAVDQLTWSQTGSSSAPTGGSNNDNNNNNNNNGNNGGNDNNNNNNGNSNNDNNNDNNDDANNNQDSADDNGNDDSAAVGLGSQSALYLAGALAMGAAALLHI